MLIYVYDDSFDGLLTSIYDAYYNKHSPERILSCSRLQYTLGDEYVYINTDYDKSAKVYKAIENKISSESLEKVYAAFLSDNEDAGTAIYNYLKLGLKLGKKVDIRLSDDRVLAVDRLSLAVEREKHKMMGFVRFRLITDGVYYAPIEPLYNLVTLLAPHFADRMATQHWVIHDLKRGIAAVYDCNEWVVTNVDTRNIPEFREKDPEYQKLWKEFYNTIAISSRINPRLQKSLMPVRYWRHLPEKW